MSYAIEVKKRKFERILESLTDNNTSTPGARASLNSRNNLTTTSSTITSELSKRRRITPTSVFTKTTSSTSLSAHYLPSNRTAFLDRLETYRNVTRWHIPSTSVINAAEWARRGWICQDTDTVSCPSCKEKLLINLDARERESDPDQDEEEQGSAEDEQDSLTLANAVYEGLIKRYHEMIITSHKDGCPWKRRGCDDSIQRIEGLLNVSNAISSLQTRYASMIEIKDIPKVAGLPSTPAHEVDQREISDLAFSDHQKLDINAVLLATCGWQKKDADVVECRHCFRSLGLWLYRGDDPTMEHLDAIDSHLEYCPWRSAERQDTEVTTGREQVKGKIPGWLLVYMAIVKDNHRRKGTQSRPATPSLRSDQQNRSEADVEATPEQREKKLKDLMRRIRELKKPLNIKSLLRKKDKDVGTRLKPV